MADDDDADRNLTFAQLLEQANRESPSTTSEPASHTPRPRVRDDELLTDLPAQHGDHHLGQFAGWHAHRKQRWIIGGSLAAATLVGAVVLIKHSREIRHEKLHPLPEVEATIAPGTPREMTLSDGAMRVGLSREPPAVDTLHLPDRDITLAWGSDKAQFKVEVRDGKTVRLKVLTGDIVETLTDPEATPLLDD
jgi:hypothetical protein